MACVAVEGDLGVVVLPGNERRIARACVNVRDGLRVYAVQFWHADGWTPKNEALMDAVVK